MRRRVIWHDIDSAWHVNNTMYLQYADDCGMQILDAYDWPVKRMMAAGFGIFVRQNRLEYLQPAVLGDEVEVATWVYNVKRATATRYYSITRVSDGAQLAQVHSFCVWVNPATGQPVRIPADFWADFKCNASGVDDAG
jgi:acyl-CoA thioester hydrolase